MTQLSNIDLGVLIVYLGGIVSLGFFMAKRAAGGSDAFMAASRSLPGWVVGLSVLGTFVSSISFLANPGKSFADNWNPFVFSLSLPIAAFIATRWFVPHYRRIGSVSAYEHLEQRFGPWARTYAGICFLLTQMARVGTILYLVAVPVYLLTGWDPTTVIIVTGVLVTAYTMLGGIEAVIWTDVVQSIVLTVGLLVSVVVLMLRMPEGPAQVFTVAAEHGKFSLGHFGPDLTTATFWVVMLNGLVINLQNFGIDQSYVQRYIAAESDSAARKSVWIGALAYLPISALLFLIGTALFAFYAVQPERLPSTVTVASGADDSASSEPQSTGAVELKSDEVFPYFIATELPAGLVGLLVAAILAAAMSSVDSSLNCAATLTLNDVYRRYLRPTATERESMIVLYAATAAFGVIGTGMGLLFRELTKDSESLDVWWQLASLFSGGMLGLFLLGMIGKRVTNVAAGLAVSLGVMVILWAFFSTQDIWPASLSTFRNPLHGFLTTVLGTAVIMVTGLMLGMLVSGRRIKDAE